MVDFFLSPLLALFHGIVITSSPASSPATDANLKEPIEDDEQHQRGGDPGEDEELAALVRLDADLLAVLVQYV